LIGPMFYYYIRSLVKGKIVIDRYLFILIIPFPILLINILPYFQYPFTIKLKFAAMLQQNYSLLAYPVTTLLIPFFYVRLLIPISNLIFAGYAIIYLHRKKNAPGFKKKTSNLTLKFTWLLFTVISPLLILAMYSTLESNIQHDITFRSSIMHIDNFIYVITLLLPISFFMIPSWLYGANTNVSIIDQVKNYLHNMTENSKNKVPVKFEKTTDLERIIEYIHANKPYLKSDFSVHDLSIALNIPQIRISNCFNKQLNIPFPIYRNRLRVANAVNMLLENKHINMSIEGIAAQSGFTSKSTFYAAFRTEYGITPSEWMAKNL
jgi:AraC-like DNA-binding protein